MTEDVCIKDEKSTNFFSLNSLKMNHPDKTTVSHFISITVLPLHQTTKWTVCVLCI